MADALIDDAFLTEQHDGVLTITFNRPDQGNATPSAAVPLLSSTFRAAQLDSRVRCILINARGRHFCSGGNVATFASEIALGQDALAAAFETRMTNASELVEAMLAFDRPILSAIRGAVAGGGLLYALAADLVVADDTAMFLFAHQRMGLSPDAGVSWLLPRVVGLRQARTLVFRGSRVQASEAARLGLISELVAADALDAVSLQRAHELSAAPQRAIRNAKLLTGQASSATLAEHLRAESRSVMDCVADPDFTEGVQAFLEKRPSRFPSAQSMT